MALTVTLEASPILGFATVHNDVPVVRSLSIQNESDVALANLQVVIACSPPFAAGANLLLDALAPGEIRSLGIIDLRPDHAYLRALNEAEHSTVTVSVRSRDEVVGEATAKIEVLACEQWSGSRGLVEMIAAFVEPNARAVDRLLGKAGEALQASDRSLHFDGYKSKNRESVLKQLSALYSVVCREGVSYVLPPASFAQNGQKIRSPDRVLDAKVGTCLDLAILFASCIEQAGLRPLLIFTESHAFVGCWLVETNFPTPVVDDVQAVRKRESTGELLVFETTCVTHAPRPSFRFSISAAKSLLEDSRGFRFAVDINRARERRIRPIPSHQEILTFLADVEGRSAEPAVEELPPLPPLDPSLLPPVEINRPDGTPDARLANWKRKLLDLTLRNKLLNFRPTKTSFAVVTQDLQGVESRLSQRKELSLRAAPALMTGLDDRVAAVHQAREGQDAMKQLAADALSKNELVLDVPDEKLEGKLLEAFLGAQTSLEEGGANTLYLAMGMLHWTEASKAGSKHLAPILLVPVSLVRQSVRSRYRLLAHDDDPIVNPTLVLKLKDEFGLQLPSFESLPELNEGIDVEKILQSFRIAVKEMTGWEVLTVSYLAGFSFTKYLMWKDLQDRTEKLKNNRVVEHLINRPGTAFPGEGRIDARTLDHRYRPEDLLVPLRADSSQLVALATIAEGRDIVIKGPPGTGKSQVISSAIAHLLGTGKTVLFVSEKMAALEVVHRRLRDVGLGDFCLEIHSSKSKKSDVVEQIGAPLNAAAVHTAEEWEHEANRLGRLRMDLNAVVDALHKPRKSGLTVYQAAGTTAANAERQLATFDWPTSDQHSRAELDDLRDTVSQMQVLAGEIPDFAHHPLRLLGQVQWSPTWAQEWLKSVLALERATLAFDAAAQPICKLLGLAPTGQAFSRYHAIDNLAEVLLGVPAIAPGIVSAANDSTTLQEIEEFSTHGKARDAIWASFSAEYRRELATIKSSALGQEWDVANARWLLPRWIGHNKVRHRLRAVRLDGKDPPAQNVRDILDRLERLNSEDEILFSLHNRIGPLLTGVFQKGDEVVDWDAIRSQKGWASRFAKCVGDLAGADLELLARLQTSLRQLTSQNRQGFAPEGPLGAALLVFRYRLRDFVACIAEVNKLSTPVEPLLGPPGSAGTLARVSGILASWRSGAGQVRSWCQWRKIRSIAIERGLQGLVTAIEQGDAVLSNIREFFEASYQAWWLKRIVDVEPVLRDFSTADHHRKILAFRDADRNFEKLIQRHIVATLFSKVPTGTAVVPSADSELGKLRHEMGKRRNHISVRQLVKALPTLLPRLKPCMLMSPLSVAQYLDAQSAIVDVVIFDEASQIPVADAIGAIARGKQLVVVGDPEQLPPTNFFQRGEDGDSDEFTPIEDLESVLDECLGSGLPVFDLQWHYRSKSESLIHFSNATYYEGKLITFPSPVTNDTAVRFEKVNGVYDRGGSRTNRAEAESVVAAVEEHFLDPERTRMSLGVVTFNQPQQLLITQLLDRRRAAHEALDRAILQHKHEPVFVKNLENVQGDERSCIYFSITYGPDSAGRTTMTFGPLSQEGGQRRLNVAVSRAREQVVVFSSLMPEQIDLSRVSANGARDLKRYLDFAIRGPIALSAQSGASGREPDSPFEIMVARALRARGWTVHPQVGCSGYRIDLAIVDPRAPGRYLVGVECDGATYHSAANARDRDRLRQEVLEELGWRIHRIWSTDWWQDPNVQIAKLDAKLKEWTAEPLPSARLEDPEAEGSSLPVATKLETPVQAPTRSSLPELEVYRTASLPDRSRMDFYERRSYATISQDVAAVLAVEGPVEEMGNLLPKVARAWGQSRTGSRIVEILRSTYPHNAVITEEDGVRFVWPPGVAPNAWAGFRVATDGREESQRHHSTVCREELANIADHCLRSNGSMSEVELCRQVSRYIGLSRLAADGLVRLQSVIAWMADEGRVSRDGDRISLAANRP